MGRHSGGHHSSSGSHSGSHHSSSRSHSGGHHGGSGGSSRPNYSTSRNSQYRYKSSTGSNCYFSDDMIPVGAKFYNGTWYQQNGQLETFDINMDDEYVAKHYDSRKTTKLYRLLREKPALIIALFYGFFFATAILFSIASSNIFYEIVIPIFENADMTDAAFFIVDECVYYVQFLLPVLWLVGFPVLSIKGYNRSKAYELGFVKEVIEYYGIVVEEKKIPYLAVCPMCGASVKATDTDDKIKFCSYCGGSLRADGMQ